MIRSLWTSASGMQAQQTNIDVIANNLANVNTTGFKKSKADFQDLLYQTMRSPGANSSQAGNMVPTGVQLGNGVHNVSISKIYQQGTFIQTGNDLDMAIEGDGFFQVQMPDGTTAYTRDGSFKLDSTGQVVTPDGYLLQPGFTLPTDTTQITIASDGSFSILQSGQVNPTNLGQVQLAQFVNPSGLQAMGRNLMVETAASGTAQVGNPGEDGMGTIAHRAVEQSNVNMVEEMVNMIASQRAYEINSKTIQASDDMLSLAANLRR